MSIVSCCFCGDAIDTDSHIPDQITITRTVTEKMSKQDTFHSCGCRDVYDVEQILTDLNIDVYVEEGDCQ